MFARLRDYYRNRGGFKYRKSGSWSDGGIQGGRVVGASDDRGAYVADRPVTIGDLFATLYKALGIDWTKTYLGPGNRPVYIANSKDNTLGQPVEELF